MRLNHKVRYGLECLFELAKAPGEFTDAEHLSTARNIPPAYAQKVLQALTHAGIVQSQKGSGYRIVRSLQDITALEVMNALTTEDAQLPRAGHVLESRINDALAGMTLDALAA